MMYLVRDGSGGFAKHVGNDSNIANGKHVLITVFLTGFVGNQLESVSCVLPQYTDVFARDKTAGNKPEWNRLPIYLESLAYFL